MTMTDLQAKTTAPGLRRLLKMLLLTLFVIAGTELSA